MQVTARLMNGQTVVREITVDQDIPNTLKGLVERFGEEMVVNQAVDAIVIAVQAFIRTKMKSKERLTDQQIKDACAKWQPGQRRAADPAAKKEKMKAWFSALSKEEQKEFLKSMKTQ